MACAIEAGTSVQKARLVGIWGRSIGVVQTCSEAALVDPGVHVCALVFELVELVLRILHFVLEVVDLVLVRSDCIIERSEQRIRRGLHGSSDWTVRHVGSRSYWRTSRCRIVTLVAGGGGSIGVQFVLGIEAAGVLSVFVGWALMIADGVWVV